MSDFFDRIKEITARNLELSTWVIEKDTTLNRLGADSLDGIGLIMAIELELGFLVPKEAFSSVAAPSSEMTFGAFVDIIENSAAAGAPDLAELSESARP